MTTIQLTSALAEAGKRKLNLTSLAVLLHCAETEGVSFSALARLLGKTSGCISVIADKLQERDLVRRRSIRGGDRRTWSLAVTDHGYGLLHNILSLPTQTTTKQTTTIV
jgi:DNA-binding MarR family transcriptional regulator